MRTIYIKEKKSGNFEFSNRKESTHKFTTKKKFEEWFKNLGSKQLIKATYRLSQTYFSKYEFESAFKKAKEIFS